MGGCSGEVSRASSSHGHPSREAHQAQHVSAMLAQGHASSPSGDLSVSPVFARRQKQAPLGEDPAELLSKNGGPDRDRTGDLLNAIQARSQLRYRPFGWVGTFNINALEALPAIARPGGRRRDLPCPRPAL